MRPAPLPWKVATREIGGTQVSQPPSEGVCLRRKHGNHLTRADSVSGVSPVSREALSQVPSLSAPFSPWPGFSDGLSSLALDFPGPGSILWGNGDLPLLRRLCAPGRDHESR
jgi:hypothetical protein